MVEEQEAWESLVGRRMDIIRKYREEFPLLGSFGAEQYQESGRSMGSVFLPPDLTRMNFTKLKQRDIRNVVMSFAEGKALDGEEVSHRDIEEFYFWVKAQVEGWVTDKYLQTGLAALSPQPLKKVGPIRRWLRGG